MTDIMDDEPFDYANLDNETPGPNDKRLRAFLWAPFRKARIAPPPAPKFPTVRDKPAPHATQTPARQAITHPKPPQRKETRTVVKSNQNNRKRPLSDEALQRIREGQRKRREREQAEKMERESRLEPAEETEPGMVAAEKICKGDAVYEAENGTLRLLETPPTIPEKPPIQHDVDHKTIETCKAHQPPPPAPKVNGYEINDQLAAAASVRVQIKSKKAPALSIQVRIDPKTNDEATQAVVARTYLEMLRDVFG